jgi:murein DD-endopeptidase MepM/ murein hydrolase activator NlpD
VEGSLLWEYGWLPQGVSEQFHEGVDFLAKAGSPVVAVQEGTVVAVRQDQRLGLVVEIRHGDVTALYGQVEGVTVRAGDQVKRGGPIGRVSRAVGVEQNMPPHLHFEVRPAATGEPVDPASYLGLGGKQL